MKEIVTAILGFILIVSMFVIVPLVSASTMDCIGLSGNAYWRCVRIESEREDMRWEQERRQREIEWELDELNRKLDNMEYNRSNW